MLRTNQGCMNTEENPTAGKCAGSNLAFPVVVLFIRDLALLKSVLLPARLCSELHMLPSLVSNTVLMEADIVLREVWQHMARSINPGLIKRLRNYEHIVQHQKKSSTYLSSHLPF